MRSVSRCHLGDPWHEVVDRNFEALHTGLEGGVEIIKRDGVAKAVQQGFGGNRALNLVNHATNDMNRLREKF